MFFKDFPVPFRFQMAADDNVECSRLLALSTVHHNDLNEIICVCMYF